MTDTLTRIDQTLAYYSTGLDAEIVVPVEKPDAHERVVRAVAQLTAAFAATLPSLLEALRRAAPVVLANFDRTCLDARRRVYRRWNDPLARAAMWRRKAARAVR